MDRIKKLATGTTTVNVCPISKAVAASLMVLVIMLVYSYYRALGDADASLYGMWMVDTDFAERAGLDEMVLFISPPGKKASAIGMSGAICPGYMLIKSGGGTVFNGPIKIKIKRASIRADTIHKYNVDFGEALACVPRRVTLEYDSVTSMITLMNKKTMYGRLFKKSEASYFTAMGDQPIEDPADRSGSDNDEPDESTKNEDSGP